MGADDSALKRRRISLVLKPGHQTCLPPQAPKEPKVSERERQRSPITIDQTGLRRPGSLLQSAPAWRSGSNRRTRQKCRTSNHPSHFRIRTGRQLSTSPAGVMQRIGATCPQTPYPDAGAPEVLGAAAPEAGAEERPCRRAFMAAENASTRGASAIRRAASDKPAPPTSAWDVISSKLA